MRIITWLGSNRFNYVDLVSIATTWVLIFGTNYAEAALVCALGLVGSAWLTSKISHDEEK